MEFQPVGQRAELNVQRGCAETQGFGMAPTIINRLRFAFDRLACVRSSGAKLTKVRGFVYNFRRICILGHLEVSA